MEKMKKQTAEAQMMKLLRVAVQTQSATKTVTSLFMKDSDEEVDTFEIEKKQCIEYMKRTQRWPLKGWKQSKSHAGSKHT